MFEFALRPSEAQNTFMALFIGKIERNKKTWEKLYLHGIYYLYYLI